MNGSTDSSKCKVLAALGGLGLSNFLCNIMGYILLSCDLNNPTPEIIWQDGPGRDVLQYTMPHCLVGKDIVGILSHI